MLQQYPKRVYQQLNGKIESSKKHDTDESRRFWSNIWGTGKSHNKSAEWLEELRPERNKIKQGNIQITTEMIIQQGREVPNWKCPGSDGVQGYWLKTFPTLHERIVTQMDDMINNGMDIPKWMTTAKTILCQKDSVRGIAVDNYQPISCLPLMWKLMTGITGCRRNSRGTEDQLLIDKMVLNYCKKRHTNLGMAWTDYKKAYDMIPHSWILESLGLVQVPENIVEFIRKSIKN